MRTVRAVVAGAVLAGSILSVGVVSASTATAIDPGTGIVGAGVAPSWQTNGVVYAISASHGIVYVGGSFTSVRPPGAPVGTAEVPRPGVAAFDIETGDLVTGFAPAFTITGSAKPTVYALATSPD